jgi:hypothetical protein
LARKPRPANIICQISGGKSLACRVKIEIKLLHLRIGHSAQTAAPGRCEKQLALLGVGEGEKQLTEAKLIETIRGTIGYLFFVMIFTVVAFTTRNSSEYWANAAMRGKFVDDAFFFGEVTHEKTLHDVHFVPLFYDWLGGQFLESVTSVELGGESGYLNGYNRIIGPVR